VVVIWLCRILVCWNTNEKYINHEIRSWCNLPLLHSHYSVIFHYLVIFSPLTCKWLMAKWNAVTIYWPVNGCLSKCSFRTDVTIVTVCYLTVLPTFAMTDTVLCLIFWHGLSDNRPTWNMLLTDIWLLCNRSNINANVILTVDIYLLHYITTTWYCISSHCLYDKWWYDTSNII
jgi:hypothetical protein